jgi:two-component system CheB/CheR fusion protein
MVNDKNIILVIDDDEDIISYFTAVFKIRKIKSHYIYDAKNAIKFFEKHKDIVKLILMDIKLDDMSGYELAPKLLKIKNVNIVAQSAYVYYSEKIKILKCGCVDFISKPISIKHLDKILNKYFFKD